MKILRDPRAPDGDIPFGGRARESLTGVRVLGDPLSLEWDHSAGDAAGTPLVRDRVTGAYAVGRAPANSGAAGITTIDAPTTDTATTQEGA